jgi:hypothetical protein
MTWQKTRPGDDTDSHCGWAFAADDEIMKNPAGYGSFPSGPAYGKALHILYEPIVREQGVCVYSNTGTLQANCEGTSGKFVRVHRCTTSQQ